jgi:hypothetical protein
MAVSVSVPYAAQEKVELGSGILRITYRLSVTRLRSHPPFLSFCFMVASTQPFVFSRSGPRVGVRE